MEGSYPINGLLSSENRNDKCVVFLGDSVIKKHQRLWTFESGTKRKATW